MQAVVFVPNTDTWSGREVGGLTLLERLARQLRAGGFEPPMLLVPQGSPPPCTSARAPLGAVLTVPRDSHDVFDALAAAGAMLPASFVFTSADRLVDLRVFHALAGERGMVVTRSAGGGREPVGRVDASAVRQHGAAFAARARPFDPATLDPYVVDLRGDVPPYVLAVASDADRARAWVVLLDHAQKRKLDLPGRWFDSWFEDALVRRLAPTRVTPNAITLTTTLVAGVVATAFLHGYLVAGVVLALVVGVLDGVDGKLARIRLEASRLGALEHVVDFFYENAWYLALGTWLERATGDVDYWRLALVLVAADVADNLLYVAARRRTGRVLDEITPFDAAFRTIAGRRNVYVWFFVVGVAAGAPGWAFVAAVVWAVLTAAVHGVRVVTLLTPAGSPVPAPQRRAELDVDAAAAALVRDE